MCCYTATHVATVHICRLVPSSIFPPGHHVHEETDQLVLLAEVLAGPEVSVVGAAGQVLLVLPHLQLAGLAPPPRGGILTVAGVVPGHPQHVIPDLPGSPGGVYVPSLVLHL